MPEDQTTDLETEVVAQDQTQEQPEKTPNYPYSQRENILRMREVMDDQARKLREFEHREREWNQKREEEPAYSHDDPVDMGILEKRLTKAEKKMFQNIKPLIEKVIQEKEIADYVSKAPDYWDVIDKYANQLQKYYPHLARLLTKYPEDSPIAAYEAIIAAPWYKGAREEPVRQAPARRPKPPEPPSGMTASAGHVNPVSALGQARSYQNMAVGDDLWAQYVKDTGFAG